MLNEMQQQAVTTPNASALIIAGAGAGKTSVLVSRLAHHLESGVSPDKLMAVTFTNKAAFEIKHRLETHLNQSLNNLWLGTFHSLCYRMLIMHLKAKFKVISQSRQTSILKQLIESSKVEIEPRKLLTFINAQKDKGLRATDSNDELERLYMAYQTYCKENLLMDFGDLLLRCYELLSDYPKLLEHYQNKFDFVLVDEAQDTNFIQYEFLKLLTHQKQNMFFIGDDAQSIYGFRGAVLENLFTFQAEYPSHELIKLEQNYRCSKNILEAANQVISHNAKQFKKVLYTNNPDGDKITVYTAHNDQKEASYIASEILRLKGQGTALNDIAILYRTNLQSEVVMQTLQQMQIPFYVSKGQRFFERQEIKTVLSYLQLALDCHDNGSFDYVINVPQRGIGLATKQKISSYADSQNLSYWKACESMMQSNLLTGKALQGVLEFMALIKMLSESVLELSLSDAVRLIIDKTNLIQWYARSDDGSDRLENIDELLKLAGEFKADDSLELSIFEQFLAHACLSNEEETGHGVQLMTLHASKGLEFETVFLIGLEQNLFPSKKGDLEEERRLMYVAITRAKKRLIITHARQRQLYGSTQMQRPSVFLNEIPSQLLDVVSDKPTVSLKLPEGVTIH